MKKLWLAALSLIALSSCSTLNRGDSFNQNFGGVEYNFEVIVSKMRFVRVAPVSGPSVIQGDIVIPSTAEFNGVTYRVTQVAPRAFMNYGSIRSVKLPSGLTTIEAEAFAGCSTLQYINTPQPLSVIGDYAFDGCSSLREFSLDASISELGVGAFRGCSGLQYLDFTPTFSIIPDELCAGCTGLREIILPSTVMHVGASAFEGCISAKIIEMDRSVQTLGDRAFYGCVGVNSIYCMTATPPACTDMTFNGISTGIPVTVPMASLADYQNAIGWYRFYNIVGQY